MVRQGRKCRQQRDDPEQRNLFGLHVDSSWILSPYRYLPSVIGSDCRDRRQILNSLLVVATRSVLGPEARSQAISIEVVFIAREFDQFVFLQLQISRNLDWFCVVLRVINGEVELQVVPVGTRPPFNQVQ